ncbi:MAG: Ig-like domain-containing protein [bacterium]
MIKTIIKHTFRNNFINHILSLLYLLNILVFILLTGYSNVAAEGICARVKMEILQELTFERIAFDAMMKIHNESDIPLSNIRVDIHLQNAQREDVSSLFFVRLVSKDNINAVDGTGTVPAASTSEIHWLIVPSAGAGGNVPQGQLYYAGATLGYNIGGVQSITNVIPDTILVKPQPMLILDYFQPMFVYGDDPFTPETEAPVPYSLGLRVQNVGFGTAKNLVIDSGQPTIVDNEEGLLIDFRILESEVNGLSAENSLLINFGDIMPNSCGTCRWHMISTLSGEFIEFTVNFSHADELGGELTSLIQEARPHVLVHDVVIDVPGRDLVKDFLAYDDTSLLVYESDNIDTDVADISSQAVLTGSLSSMNSALALDFPQQPGAIYVRLPDPAKGNIGLSSVVRSDGKKLLKENFWISHERENHQWNAYLNLFDIDSTGTYILYYQTEHFIDTEPPITRIIINEPSFLNNLTYVNRSTEFLFVATDNMTEVREINFMIDEGAFGSAPNPFMFSQHPAYEEGYHKIYFYSVDNEGNEESPQFIEIYLDTHAPVIETYSATPSIIMPAAPPAISWVDRSLLIEYGFSDDTGKVTVSVQILSGENVVWEYQETISSHTPSYIEWQGRDNDGNLVSPGYYAVLLEASDPLLHTTVSQEIPVEIKAYFTEHPLSPCDQCEQMHPDIAGDIILWQDNRGGDWDIYLYDLTQQMEKNLTPHAGDQTYPATDGARIVWQDTRSGNEDIYLYDRVTDQEIVIEAHPSSQMKPVIAGDWIVWQDNRYGNWDIYAYNMQTHITQKITQDTADQINPSVSNQIIVWEDYRHGAGEIYLYDLSADDEQRITEDMVNQTDPHISNGTIIWIDQRSGKREIFLFECETNSEIPLTDDSYDHAQPAIEGRYIIYTDYSMGIEDSNPWFNILGSSYFLMLTNDPAPQEEPDISGNIAVWQDFRTGHWQIFTEDIAAYFPDSDQDGVVDDLDKCPDTPLGEVTDNEGCSDSTHDESENSAPVAHYQVVTTNEDEIKEILLFASDPDDDLLTYEIITYPAHGVVEGIPPLLSYIPEHNYFGTDTIQFIAYDGTSESGLTPLVIIVNPVNDMPIAHYQSVSTYTYRAVGITLIATDIDNNELTFQIVTFPIHGFLSGTPPYLIYTPEINYTGVDSFEFKAHDGALESNVATVIITVNSVSSGYDVNIDMNINVNIDVENMIESVVGSDHYEWYKDLEEIPLGGCFLLKACE